MAAFTFTAKTATWPWWKLRRRAYREKGSFTLPDQPNRGRSKAWAYPVVANGRLYVRDLDTLWCYDVKGP